jgi:hypothetical protein
MLLFFLGLLDATANAAATARSFDDGKMSQFMAFDYLICCSKKHNYGATRMPFSLPTPIIPSLPFSWMSCFDCTGFKTATLLFC